MRSAVPLLVALALLGASGCADVCDDAICRLEEECDIATDRDPDAPCEGENRLVSQCIVDHTREACAYFYDPVAEADNAFALCLAASE